MNKSSDSWRTLSAPGKSVFGFGFGFDFEFFGVFTYDVIGVTAKAGDLRRTGRLHLQNVPDIFVGSFERAESDRNPEQSLPAPDIARRYKDFSHLKVKSCQKF